MEFADLFKKFPITWRNIFQKSSFSCKDSPEVCDLPIWQKRVKEASHVDWSALVDSLGAEEPEVSGGKLIFTPCLFLLPASFRRDLAGFIYLHRKKLIPETLDQFIHVLTSTESKDEWLGMYTVLFQQHVILKMKKQITGKDFPAYQFSEANRAAAEEVCQLLYNSSQPGPQHQLSKEETAHSNVPTTPETSLPQPIDVETPIKEETPCEQNASSPKRPRLELTADSRIEDSTLSESICTQSQRPQGLDAELLVTVSLLRETWHGSADAKSRPPSDIAVLTRCTNHQMELICRELDLEHLSEVGIATACEHMVSLAKDLTYSNTECFARACLLPQIQNLQQNLSRTLFTSLTSFTKAFPQQTISACLVPAVCAEGTSVALADLISRLLKTVCTPSQGQDFLRVLLSAGPVWDENLVSVIQTLVDNKIEMSLEILESLLSSFAAGPTSLANNLKFTKLVLALLNKYGSEMSSTHTSHANHIVMGNKTFLKKPLLAALKKIS